MNEIMLEDHRRSIPDKFICCPSRRKYYLGKQFPEIYLTQREAECVYWVMKGLTNKQTADKMELSSRTIDYYLRNVRTKLNCYSKAHLIRVLDKACFLSEIEKQTMG